MKQLTALLEMTLNALGYELAGCERTAGGLLRIFIDHPKGITLADCEKASRQLQHVLIVENIVYQRLEVSSPGLDRPLRTLSDFARAAGKQAVIMLKMPLNGRKKYQGMLHPPCDETMSLEVEGHQVSRLDFKLADLDHAHLVPDIDFRSRK
jgi:ribosome maturation factor RimP